MMEYWTNEILSSEKKNNGFLAEFYNWKINGIIQNSLKIILYCCMITDSNNRIG